MQIIPELIKNTGNFVGWTFLYETRRMHLTYLHDIVVPRLHYTKYELEINNFSSNSLDLLRM